MILSEEINIDDATRKLTSFLDKVAKLLAMRKPTPELLQEESGLAEKKGL